MSNRRPARLNSARAYYRLAAKAARAGQYRQSERYTRVADRLVADQRHHTEARKQREAADAAFRAKCLTATKEG